MPATSNRKNKPDTKGTTVKKQAFYTALDHFLHRHPPHRLARNLRTMLLEYLQQDAAQEAPYMKDLLFDLEGLFNLLDAATDTHSHSPAT